MGMFKKISSQFLVDLGGMEDDYRVFYLRDDIAYSTLYISIAVLGIFSLFRIDTLLYPGRPDLSEWLMLYRTGYTLISLLIVIAIRKTGKVKRYDQLVFIWLL